MSPRTRTSWARRGGDCLNYYNTSIIFYRCDVGTIVLYTLLLNKKSYIMKQKLYWKHFKMFYINLKLHRSTATYKILFRKYESCPNRNWRWNMRRRLQFLPLSVSEMVDALKLDRLLCVVCAGPGFVGLRFVHQDD